jgi:hypothetical protein
MGILNRFKKVFEKEEDLELMPIVEIKAWLTKRAREIVYNTKNELSNYAKKLKDKRWILECNLDEWKEKLKNEENEENEEIYDILTHTKKILEQITFSDNFEPERILSLSWKLEVDFEELTRKVEANEFVQNYSILLSETEKEKVTVNPLLKEVLEMEGIRKDLEQILVKSGLRKIETILKKLEKLEKNITQLDELGILLKHKVERAKQIESSKLEKEKAYTLLKEDQLYKDVKETDIKKSEIREQLKEIVSNAQAFFNDLKPVLKAEIFCNKELIEIYLSDVVAAFSKDEELSILHLLLYAKEALTSGQIALEADEVEGAYFRLCDLENFKLWHQNYFNLKRDQRELNLSIGDHGFLAKVEDARYRLEHFTAKTEFLQEEIYLLEDKINEKKENIFRDKNLIKNLMKIGLGKNVEVVF